jgi:hypothetical protein
LNKTQTAFGNESLRIGKPVPLILNFLGECGFVFRYQKFLRFRRSLSLLLAFCSADQKN